ncbi:MAG: DUF4259 domain-containing protein [Myxococcaceae bacterium]
MARRAPTGFDEYLAVQVKNPEFTAEFHRARREIGKAGHRVGRGNAMGTWGTGIYEDDHALDAVADLRDASDPTLHLESTLANFLERTRDQFDQSEFARDWAVAHSIFALCDVVKTAAGDPSHNVPTTVRTWLTTSRYQPSQHATTLAAKCCERLSQSNWLRNDWPEFWSGSVVLLLQHFSALSNAETSSNSKTAVVPEPN